MQSIPECPDLESEQLMIDQLIALIERMSLSRWTVREMNETYIKYINERDSKQPSSHMKLKGHAKIPTPHYTPLWPAWLLDYAGICPNTTIPLLEPHLPPQQPNPEPRFVQQKQQNTENWPGAVRSSSRDWDDSGRTETPKLPVQWNDHWSTTEIGCMHALTYECYPAHLYLLFSG